MTEDERIDAEIANLRAYGKSLGDKCPLWLSAMGEADWEAERYFRGKDREAETGQIHTKESLRHVGALISNLSPPDDLP